MFFCVFFYVSYFYMPDYSKAKIYKLVNNSSDDVYYGSTCQYLSSRKGDHRKCYNNFIKTKNINSKLSSLKIYEPNPDDVEIILVEEFPCDNKEQLLMRERYYIENNKCVNRICPIKTRDELKQHAINYRNNNKEHKRKYDKKYREDKKDYIKNRRAKKAICFCGIIYCARIKTQHEKSKKHQNYLESLN